MADQVIALSAWLDPHLVLLVLRSLSETQDVTEARLKLLSGTRLSTDLESVYTQVYGSPVPPGKYQLYDERQQTSEEIAQIRGDLELGISDRKATLRLSKLLYDTGDYEQAGTVLEKLVEKDVWGAVHAAIASKRIEEAFSLVQSLKTQKLTYHQQLWLLHLSLFISFPSHPTLLLDLVQTSVEDVVKTCPHLARYFAAAYLLIQDYAGLSTLVTVQGKNPTDILTLVAGKTLKQFDFKGALGQFTEVTDMLKEDFFLSIVQEQLGTSLQRFVIETYLRVHSKVSLEELASYLGRSVDATEVWAANLIRHTRLEAVIEDSNIKIIRNSHSLYTQVIDKTREAYFRSKVLLANIKAS